MNIIRGALATVSIAFVCTTFVQADSPDIYNPAKLYYSVFTKETRAVGCYTRTDYSRHFANGRDAYLAQPPAGFKKYGGWCWKKGKDNCNEEIVWHGMRPWCQNSGCRLGVFNDAVVCDKKR